MIEGEVVGETTVSRVPAATSSPAKKSARACPQSKRRTVQNRHTYLRELDLAHEANAEVFEDDTVGRGEEGEDVRDEVLLVIAQGFPVLDVVGKVNLLGCEIEDGTRRLATTVNWRVLQSRKGTARAWRDRMLGRETGWRVRVGGYEHVPVQKEASAFLYISQMSPYLMGNMVKRSSFLSSSGSAKRFSVVSSAPIVERWFLVVLVENGSETTTRGAKVVSGLLSRRGDE